MVSRHSLHISPTLQHWNYCFYTYPLLLDSLQSMLQVGAACCDDYDMSNSHGSDAGITYILTTTDLASPWNSSQLVHLQPFLGTGSMRWSPVVPECSFIALLIVYSSGHCNDCIPMVAVTNHASSKRHLV